MKPIPLWLIALAFLSVANQFWGSSNSCCMQLCDTSDFAACVDEKISPAMIKSREALSKLQNYIGQWRGVGQPKRGSTKDSWVEKSAWAWNFGSGDVSLKLDSADAKYFRSAELRPAAKADEYELIAKTIDGTDVKYRGVLGADGLILTAARQVEGIPARVSIRLVADGDRMVVLYERQADADHFTRLAEVGSTRQGSGFGKGTSYIECVVTGGLGTIAVTHQGKTYYVWCTGCRDYFNDNAEDVLAEYRARQEAKKSKK
jgi:hypothetical protein